MKPKGRLCSFNEIINPDNVIIDLIFFICILNPSTLITTVFWGGINS